MAAEQIPLTAFSRLATEAIYVALAEAIAAPVVTCDSPLAKAPGHRVRIEVID